jgi:hypothetical protein
MRKMSDQEVNGKEVDGEKLRIDENELGLGIWSRGEKIKDGNGDRIGIAGGKERRNGMWMESVGKEQRLDQREIDILVVTAERRAHTQNRRQGREFESFLGMCRSLTLGNA